jgi:hypothetical protein
MRPEVAVDDTSASWRSRTLTRVCREVARVGERATLEAPGGGPAGSGGGQLGGGWRDDHLAHVAFGNDEGLHDPTWVKIASRCPQELTGLLPPLACAQ